MSLLPDPIWTAFFTPGVILEANEDSWTVYGENDQVIQQVTDQMMTGMTTGWPELAGWSLSTEPGWDDELMALRFYSIGATDVIGPFPQKNEGDELPPGTIVG